MYQIEKLVNGLEIHELYKIPYPIANWKNCGRQK